MNDTQKNIPRGKKPFVKPELRAVRYTPEEVVLAGCKTGPGPAFTGTCSTCSAPGS